MAATYFATACYHGYHNYQPKRFQDSPPKVVTPPYVYQPSFVTNFLGNRLWKMGVPHEKIESFGKTLESLDRPLKGQYACFNKKKIVFISLCAALETLGAMAGIVMGSYALHTATLLTRVKAIILLAFAAANLFITLLAAVAAASVTHKKLQQHEVVTKKEIDQPEDEDIP